MKKTNTKQAVTDATWLRYFNQTLYEQGVISESQRNKMALKIDNRTPSAKIDNHIRKASS